MFATELARVGISRPWEFDQFDLFDASRVSVANSWPQASITTAQHVVDETQSNR